LQSRPPPSGEANISANYQISYHFAIMIGESIVMPKRVDNEHQSTPAQEF
jgi:hypothetical protein